MKSVCFLVFQRRFFRLLTIVCFFQFSGLNNGYAYVGIVASADVPQAISAASFLTHHWVGSLSQPKLLLKDSLLFSKNTVLRIRTLTHASLKNLLQPHQLLNKLFSLTQKTSQRTLTTQNFSKDVRTTNRWSTIETNGKLDVLILQYPADYIIEHKEIWRKIKKKHAGPGKEDPFSIPKQLYSRDPSQQNNLRWLERNMKIIYEMIHIQFVNIPDADFSPKGLMASPAMKSTQAYFAWVRSFNPPR